MRSSASKLGLLKVRKRAPELGKVRLENKEKTPSRSQGPTVSLILQRLVSVGTPAAGGGADCYSPACQVGAEFSAVAIARVMAIVNVEDLCCSFSVHID